MLPHAGAAVYIRRSYGDLAAFLFGWMRFVRPIRRFILGPLPRFFPPRPDHQRWATRRPCRPHDAELGHGSSHIDRALRVKSCLAVVVGGRVQRY